MSELLIELFSEEIPARMQKDAAETLKTMICDGFSERGISFKAARAYVTPRRLALMVDGLPEKQPDVKEEKRGPRADAPQAALDGFLRSSGLKMEDLEKRKTEKGEFFFATVEKKGQPVKDVIAEIMAKVLPAFPWPKSQRWGSLSARWVRPLHSIICLFGGEVVEVEFAGVKSGNKTRGHRFLAPEEFAVKDFADYRAKLLAAKVLLDRDERRIKILDDARKLAEKAGFVLDEKDALSEEVCGLIEWPVVLMGKIDDEFMEVPSEVLVSSMGKHQKYFSLKTKDGKLAPRFIVVANMETADEGKAIVAGNERVLRARLSDARFFWTQDRKTQLIARVQKLVDRVFHARLGSDFERVDRIGKLAVELCNYIGGVDKTLVERAAVLSKADLTSGMVGEFPELQGLMGRYYALHDGERTVVADAIAEHYSPLGPSDTCPRAPISVAVSLADKLDMLTGFWLIDLKPTGSKDPFALRRAALGVIRLIIENNLRLPLSSAFSYAQGLYVGQDSGDVAEVMKEKGDKWLPQQVADLINFFAERLKVHLKGQGVRHDLISAVFAAEGGMEDDLVRLLARVDALKEFLSTDDGANLLIAYRRAANIVRIESKKDGRDYGEMPDADLFSQDEEKQLFETLMKVVDASKQKLAAESFKEAMGVLAGLRAPVDAFFDKVTVNCEDTKQRVNRLALLSLIVKAMGQMADFSKIEG